MFCTSCYAALVEILKVFVADGDGALYDTVEQATTALHTAAQELNETTSRDTIIKMFSQGLPLHDIFASVAPNHSPKLTEELFYRFDAEIGYDEVVLFPGMKTVLAHLHEEPDLKIGILTNRARPSTLTILEHVGLLNSGFGITNETVVTPSEIVPAKPNPAGLASLVLRLDGSADTTVMYGDTGGDIKTGADNGSETIGFTGGFVLVVVNLWKPQKRP